MTQAYNVFNPNGFLNFFTYGTIEVAATSASSTGTFTNPLSVDTGSVMIYNETAATVFVTFGTTASSPVATAPSSTESATSIPVASKAIVVLTKQTGNNIVAVIAPGGNGNVYFSAGVGA